LDSPCFPPEGGASRRNPLAETQFPTTELHSSAYLVRANNPSVVKDALKIRQILIHSAPDILLTACFYGKTILPETPGKIDVTSRVA
jgi:hypothetical protein